MTGVRRAQGGLASGLINTSQQIGGALGLAILATIAANGTRALAEHGIPRPIALTNGFHSAFVVRAAFAVLAAIVAAGLLKPSTVHSH
jgi:sugar phosphate permease